MSQRLYVLKRYHAAKKPLISARGWGYLSAFTFVCLCWLGAILWAGRLYHAVELFLQKVGLGG